MKTLERLQISGNLGCDIDGYEDFYLRVYNAM
jgi:hypothetical protein